MPNTKVDLVYQPCGEDINLTNQVSTVFNCYVPIDIWVSYFFIVQLALIILFAIAMIIKIKRMPSRQEESLMKIQAKLEEKYPGRASIRAGSNSFSDLEGKGGETSSSLKASSNVKIAPKMTSSATGIKRSNELFSLSN